MASRAPTRLVSTASHGPRRPATNRSRSAQVNAGAFVKRPRLRARILLVLIPLVHVGCTSETRPVPDAPLMLRSVRTFSLGRDTSETPGDITYAAVSRAGVAIVDNASRVVAAYATDGRKRWSVSFDAGDTSGVRQPNALSWWRDTLLLAEVDGAGGVWSVDKAGHAHRLTRLAMETAITSVERLGDGYLVATTESDARIEADSALVLRVFDAQGRATHAGCRLDARYAESARRRGMVAIFRSFSATSSGREVFCRQPLSREVIVLSPTLDSIRAITLPGWRPVGDERQSMDLVSINHFRASLVEWTGMWYSERALVVAGASFDEGAGRDRFIIVRCDEEGRASCAVFASEERVIGLLADSVVSVVRRESLGAPMKLRVSTIPLAPR